MKLLNRSGQLLCLFLLTSALLQVQQLKPGTSPGLPGTPALLALNSNRQELWLPPVNNYNTAPLHAAPDDMMISHTPGKTVYIRKTASGQECRSFALQEPAGSYFEVFKNPWDVTND